MLRRLQALGWTFAHDIDTARGNRDHVAIGPLGVFLLETKRPGGEVRVEDDHLYVQRLDDPDDGYPVSKLGARMRGEARRLSDEIRAMTDRRVFVQSVVVIWAPFPQGVTEVNRVAYVHGDELLDWLSSRNGSLDPDGVAAITAVVGEADPSLVRSGA